MRNAARVVEYPPVNFGDTMTIRVVDLWAIGRGHASVNGTKRHRYRSICQQQLLLLILPKLTDNCFFFGDKILDLESDFRKLSSVTTLQSFIGIIRASLMQINTEMAEKYANQRYAVSSQRKIMPQDVSK